MWNNSSGFSRKRQRKWYKENFPHKIIQLFMQRAFYERFVFPHIDDR